MRQFLFAAIWLASVSFSGEIFAQAFIESVFPPAAQRGQTTRIAIRGAEAEDAIGLWTSLPSDCVEIRKAEAEEKGQGNDPKEGTVLFDLIISDKAPLGIYGLRFATPSGLSNVHLMAIDDLSITAEYETEQSGFSNNELEDAQVVFPPVSLAGVCDSSDVDHYALDVKAGQPLSIELVGSRLGKGFDPLVTILDSQGRYVAARDNDVGLFFDCRFQHTFEKSGRYYLRINDSRFHGSKHWTYMLRLGKFPVARVALPSTVQLGQSLPVRFPQIGEELLTVSIPKVLPRDKFFFDLRRKGDDGSAWLPMELSDLPNQIENEPNDESAKATLATIPGNLHGVIGKAYDEDWYALDLKKGQRLEFHTETRGIGSAADVELRLIDPAGKEVRRVDDKGFEDATFSFSTPSDGRYQLQVVEVVRKGGPDYVYRIEIKLRQPNLDLLSEVGRLAIPQGLWQPLPLQITRTDFSGEAELSLEGAPEGMSLRNTTLAAGVKEFVAQLQVEPSTPAGLYTLKVIARGKQGDFGFSTKARTQPLVDRLPTGHGPHGEPFELREDQRRLPPSLTDCIAVLVTEPSPYDFDLVAPDVILPRYLNTQFEVAATLAKDFKGPIQLTARGGLLEKNRLQDPSVISTIPNLTAKLPQVVGKLKSGVNTNLTKHRVTITGEAVYQGRKIHLTRTFQLETKPAFHPVAEPAAVEIVAGTSLKVKIKPGRLAPYRGSVTVSPTAVKEIETPEMIMIEEKQEYVDLEMKVPAMTKPGKYTIKLPASARIGKFYEQSTGGTIEVTVIAASVAEAATPEDK